MQENNVREKQVRGRKFRRLILRSDFVKATSLNDRLRRQSLPPRDIGYKITLMLD